MGRKIRTSKREIYLDNAPLIMGILNITPDSFSDGGKYLNPDAAVNRALEMISEGANIIDVGGESTRPGSEPVSEDIEKKRVLPVIEKLAGETDIPISIDTRKSSVAEAALKAGAEIINDISGLNFDEKMTTVASRHGAAVCIMHILGRPKTMQQNIVYDSLLNDIKEYLLASSTKAKEEGIPEESIILDPGIGFGKTATHNLIILNNLRFFLNLGYPLLIGASRKSFIGKILNIEDTGERLEGTLAVGAHLTREGVDIIRTHDVLATRRVKEMILAIKSAETVA